MIEYSYKGYMNTKFYDAIKVGKVVTIDDDRVYIKPRQSRSHHLEEMLIEVGTGNIIHFSKVKVE